MSSFQRGTNGLPGMGWQSNACTSCSDFGIRSTNVGRSAYGIGFPFQEMRAAGE